MTTGIRTGGSVRKRLAATLVTGFAASGSAAAFDGAREGFQVDLSIGLGTSSVEFADGGEVRRSEDDGDGPIVNLRVGVGIGERFALYLASHSGSHARRGSPDYGFTVLGPGASWWLEPGRRGTAYLSTMLGAALLATDDDIPDGAADGGDDASGVGFYAAVGYELVNRVRFEGALRGVAVDDGFVPDGETLSLGGVYLAIGYAWY